MLSDTELLELFVVRPEKGLEKLMKHYTKYVYSVVASGISGSCKKEDIEECVSDVFVELYQNRDRIDLSKGSIKTCLSFLAKRRAIDTYRRLRRETNHCSIEGEEMDFPSETDTPELTMEKKETTNRIISEIHALGEPDSQIMIMKYYFLQSSKQIAESLGLKVNTVDKKVQRALAKLRIALGGEL